jgi:hypothetical protein
MPNASEHADYKVGFREPQAKLSRLRRRHEYLHGLQGIIDRTLIEAALDAIVAPPQFHEIEDRLNGPVDLEAEQPLFFPNRGSDFPVRAPPAPILPGNQSNS